MASVTNCHDSIYSNLRPWKSKALKQLHQQSATLFIKADTGSMTVIVKKQDYDDKTV